MLRVKVSAGSSPGQGRPSDASSASTVASPMPKVSPYGSDGITVAPANVSLDGGAAPAVAGQSATMSPTTSATAPSGFVQGMTVLLRMTCQGIGRGLQGAAGSALRSF